MDLSSISKHLKDIREEKKISQSKLANMIGIKQSNISVWELGKYAPNLEDLIKIADFFACSLDYLVGRESEDSVISITYDGEHLSDVEQNLIDLFRQMSGAQQSHFVGYGMGMLMAGA